MKLQRKHELGIDEAKRRIDRVADSIAGKFGLTSRWQGDDLLFEGSGARGQIAVTETAIQVDVRLGLALSMMQEPIRSAIEDAMDRHLA